MNAVFTHDDVIKWKHLPRYWPFVRGIHRSPVISPHKGQWRGALIFSLICVWINGWVKNRKAGVLGRYRAHYDVIVMKNIYFTRKSNWYFTSTLFYHLVGIIYFKTPCFTNLLCLTDFENSLIPYLFSMGVGGSRIIERSIPNFSR